MSESDATTGHTAFITPTPEPPAASFGGDWTKQKLRILEEYLNTYTTVLKNQPFKLMYIDAFAGTGWIKIRRPSLFGEPECEFLKGSASRALEVEDQSFDRCILVESDAAQCKALERLKQAHPDRQIDIYQADANAFLQEYNFPRSGWRGVLFLDPFATQVEWQTIERIAQLQMFDTWILFPVSAVARLLPKNKEPDLQPRLEMIYGGEAWRMLYQVQPTLFGGRKVWRESGVNGPIAIYKNNLLRLFGSRFLSSSARLKNSNGAPLFEFMFCAGHPAGAKIAKEIAGHLLRISEEA